MKKKSKDEALKNWEKKKKPSSPKRVEKSLKKKRGRLYIIVKSQGVWDPQAWMFCKDNGLTQVEEKRGGSSPSTSSTAVGFDERMLLHSEFEVKELPHVERPDRLRAIAASLATAGVFPGRCFPIHAREITKQELQMVHTSEHVDAVDTTSQLQHRFEFTCNLSSFGSRCSSFFPLSGSYFTSDTYANEYSARAARLAAGLCADLATEIFSGRVKNGFALVRPPGHHAGIKDAMGFCLHNNAAVAALVAQAAGARKVLIVDWDVHHGNGTQEIFEKTNLYCTFPCTDMKGESFIRVLELLMRYLCFFYFVVELVIETIYMPFSM
uniref:Histone deacetylase domain-containing protein n=1 Tax=Brassica campestris TaxID=3711 RepID=A0A3P5ZP15_BRACM|nr:unnamed protein product [Brassica rapa]